MANRNVADELLEAMGEAAAIAEGRRPPAAVHRVVSVPDDVDVRAIRENLGLSRPAFCARYGFDLRAVQDWEQKRRRPERAARAYLCVIAKAPWEVAGILAG